MTLKTCTHVIWDHVCQSEDGYWTVLKCWNMKHHEPISAFNTSMDHLASPWETYERIMATISSPEILQTPRGWLEFGVCPSERATDRLSRHSVTKLTHIYQEKKKHNKKQSSVTKWSYIHQNQQESTTERWSSVSWDCLDSFLCEIATKALQLPIMRTSGTLVAWIQSHVFPEQYSALAGDVTRIKCSSSGTNLWPLDPENYSQGAYF